MAAIPTEGRVFVAQLIREIFQAVQPAETYLRSNSNSHRRKGHAS